LKYELSIERSLELLREALPWMSRQEAALHPVSYAVWFDYVARTNPALREAVDTHLAREGRLDEAATHALYGRHVAEVDPGTARRIVDDMHRMLGGIADTAGQAAAHAARFGESLGRLAGALELGDTSRGMAPADGPAGGAARARPLSMVVADVIADTGTMRSQLGGLAQRLAESRREIDRLREEVRRARDEALRDALTGLANRRAFDEALCACLAARDGGEAARSAQAAQSAIQVASAPPARRPQRAADLEYRRSVAPTAAPWPAAPTPAARGVAGEAAVAADTAAGARDAAPRGPWLLRSDVDHFPRISATWGRAFGDQVLKGVADALQGLVPRGGTVARLGGEAFAILLPELDAGQARELAERVRRQVGSARIRRSGHEEEERVTLSLGLAAHRAGESAQAFVERADCSVRAARESGCDRVVAAD